MSFAEVLKEWPEERILSLCGQVGPADVERALQAAPVTPRDLVALLSPAATPRLEAMAHTAQRLTRWHFGRTISLYAPLYISNLCAADCVYCGFAARSGSREKRTTLRPEQIRNECAALAAEGFQNILLLTGEAPKAVPPTYIADAVSIAREYFNGVSIEVYALTEEKYRMMCERGLEGVTLYMETYSRETYEQVHLLGRKRDYNFRLEAIERAGRAGARRLSIGALLGLHDWRSDVVWTALHAAYLQKACWQSAISISFPRLRHTPARFHIAHTMSDVDLVQAMLATRLFLPEAGFNLSTREPAALRDRLIPLGVTHMSAGSSTRPGGYATHTGPEPSHHGPRCVLEQFEIEDTRPPAEVADVIVRGGYDPVWKDFDRAFDAP